MKDNGELLVKCEDFLKDKRYLYALKARRKKIAMLEVEATNKHTADVRVMFGAARLIGPQQTYDVEAPTVIIRKLSEFTWDFLLYSILDFHPVLAAVDFFVLLSGPIYNRRLKKQLQALSNDEMLLRPGQSKIVLLGFRGVSKRADQLQLLYCREDGEKQQVQCPILYRG